MKTVGLALAANLLLMNAPASAAASLAPELVIVDATVRSMDTNQPLAEAVAVQRHLRVSLSARRRGGAGVWLGLDRGAA
jgi:hypothetical protein